MEIHKPFKCLVAIGDNSMSLLPPFLVFLIKSAMFCFDFLCFLLAVIPLGMYKMHVFFQSWNCKNEVRRCLTGRGHLYG